MKDSNPCKECPRYMDCMKRSQACSAFEGYMDGKDWTLDMRRDPNPEIFHRIFGGAPE